MKKSVPVAHESESNVTDQAARAGWMYYMGGLTQDEIARAMDISRQRAQRLVSRAMSDGLIRVRLQHPISDLLILERDLRDKFGLFDCKVAPSLGGKVDPQRAIATLAAKELERIIREPETKIIGFGTGRAIRHAIEELHRIECEQHHFVSLIGNIAPDGRGSFYDVIMRIADIVRAPHYPMPMPVIVDSVEERELFMSLKPIKKVFDMATRADAAFVGIGHMGEDAPMHVDGFYTRAELDEVRRAGAVGEMLGWAFDANGQYVETAAQQRVTSFRIESSETRPNIALAAGEKKLPAIRGALKGGLINTLITDEVTARALIQR